MARNLTWFWDAVGRALESQVVPGEDGGVRTDGGDDGGVHGDAHLHPVRRLVHHRLNRATDRDGCNGMELLLPS